MKLHTLKLKNFKGIKELALEPKGADLAIYGNNATGKTTIADALYWLLFDKDSHNRKDFELKTLDTQTGEAFHGLPHSVAATFTLENGETLQLRKDYEEQWVKKRGGADREFSGHTTNHFVNTVPVQKKDYDAQIADVCTESLFRLLVDPNYFNVSLSWQDRRKTLLDACGDVSDADVIASDSRLAPLPELVGKHSLEDFRKILKARRTEANQHIEQIPVRIDELRKSLPELSEQLEAIDVQENLNGARQKLSELNEQKARISAGGEIGEKKKLIREVESELITIENEMRKAANAEFLKHDNAVKEIRAKKDAAWREVDRTVEDVNAQEKLVSVLTPQLDALRAAYKQIDSEVFSFKGAIECAACGQSLPTGKVEAARKRAEEHFNSEKSRKLEANKAEGIALRQRIEAASAKKDELMKANAEAFAHAERVDDEHRELCRAFHDATQPEVDLLGNPEYANRKERISELELEIQQLKDASSEALQAVDRQIVDQQKCIHELESTIARCAAAAKARLRIDELLEEERQIAAEIEQIERSMFLTEEFVKAKVSMLTEQINSKFSLARFKLFNVLVNGTIEECCETTFEGVPFSSLNHGARLNVGLDIINTLAEHYRFAPPIMIDNAESVTSIIPTKGQQIQLIVSAQDTILRIESKATQEALSI